MPDSILTRIEDGVQTLTLNRPEARNALSREMVRTLIAAAEAAEADEGIRAIVLRGAGGHFCAGGDIREMAGARAQAAGDLAEAVRDLNAGFGHLVLAYARSCRPVVVVAEGAVMGGGFGLACTADVTIATTTADFRLPETSLGLVPAQIAPFLIERLGWSEAKRLSVTGARLDAAEARGVGLVHEVCEPEELDTVLAKILEGLRLRAPGATAATKRLLYSLYAGAGTEEIERGAAVFAESACGPEAAEGMQAFLERRRPTWAKG